MPWTSPLTSILYRDLTHFFQVCEVISVRIEVLEEDPPVIPIAARTGTEVGPRPVMGIMRCSGPVRKLLSGLR